MVTVCPTEYSVTAKIDSEPPSPVPLVHILLFLEDGILILVAARLLHL